MRCPALFLCQCSISPSMLHKFIKMHWYNKSWTTNSYISILNNQYQIILFWHQVQRISSSNLLKSRPKNPYKNLCFLNKKMQICHKKIKKQIMINLIKLFTLILPPKKKKSRKRKLIRSQRTSFLLHKSMIHTKNT